MKVLRKKFLFFRGVESETEALVEQSISLHLIYTYLPIIRGMYKGFSCSLMSAMIMSLI